MAQWTHVAFTYTGGETKLYFNGSIENGGSGGLNISNVARMYLGGHWASYNYAGDMDEVKISRVARTPDWIKMEYENQRILQTFVGTLVQTGSTFSTTPASITMNENTTTHLTAQAGGAQKVYWYLVNGAQETLIAVDTFSLSFNPGRVSGAQSYSIQFRAVYATEVKTNTIPITVNDTVPDPAFTLLPLTNLWEGRSLMTVTLVMDNGGAKVTNTTIVTVQEPTNDAWVVRTPATNEVPVHNQFYARDDTGYGTLYYNGNQPGSSPTAFLKVYTNGVLYTNITQTLSGGNYAFIAKIPAGLIQHNVEFGTGAVVLATVTNIVCGDAFLVDGQSNAVTVPDDGAEPNPYTNLWIRSYGLTLG